MDPQGLLLLHLGSDRLCSAVTEALELDWAAFECPQVDQHQCGVAVEAGDGDEKHTLSLGA